MNSVAISSLEAVAARPSICAERPGMRASPRSSGSTGDATPIVYVVGDDVLVSESLKLMIEHAGWQPSVCASAEDVLARPRLLGPCCLILDVTLPGLSGLDLRKLVAERMEMPVIFTGDGDVPTVVRAMKAGAIDFLTKPFDAQTLLTAIAVALDRSRLALRHEAEQQELSKRFTSLTPREREVMTLVVAGRLNKQVGCELGISEITVKLHRRNVMRKMRVRSLAELVRLAARLSLAPLSSTSASPDVDGRSAGYGSDSPKSHCDLHDTRGVMESQLGSLKSLSRDETRILVKVLERLLANSKARESGSDQPRGAHYLRTASDSDRGYRRAVYP
jgi:FixJ family two-component response regulator